MSQDNLRSETQLLEEVRRLRDQYSSLESEVAERSRAEQTLRDELARVQQYLDETQIMLIGVDPNGRVASANKAACNVLGYPNEAELIGRDWFETCFPGSVAVDVRAGFERFVSGDPRAMSYRSNPVKTRRGEERHIAWHNSLLRDTNGEVIGVLGSGVDITERRIMEHALRMTQFAVDRASDSVFWMGPDAHFIYVNDAACEALGYTRDELLTMTVHDIDPLFPAEVWPDHWKELKKRGSTVIESQHRTKDGRVFPVEISINFLEYEGREYNIAFARDIAERRQAEEAVRQSEIRFRSMIEHTSDAVFCYEYDPPVPTAMPREEQVRELYRGVLVECNDVAAAFYGATQVEEVVGRRLTEVFGVEDRSLDAFFRQFIENGYHQVDAEAAEVLPDGSRRYFLNNGHGVLENGSLVRVWGTFRDVTERRRAQEALERSERSLAEAQSAARLGSWERDFRMNTLTCSDELFRLAGLSPQEFEPTMEDFLAFVHPEDRPKLLDALERMHRGGAPLDLELRMIRKDGAQRWVHGRGYVIFDDEGRLERSIGTAQDITERKEAEEARLALEARVQEAQRVESLSELAGGVAHDFNNLLMGVLGNAELALEDLKPTAPARQSVEKIREAALRAADLSRQMLAYSGRAKFAVSRVNLSDVVTEMDQLLKSSISKNATVVYDLAEGMPLVDADATELRQVVMNLVSNASESLGDGAGTIRVSTGTMECTEEYLSRARVVEGWEGGPCVYVGVSDDGCGMDERTVGRMFDPFFTTKLTGRGLGLAAVLGIVRGHDGAILVDSMLGEGTTVEVLFPTAEQDAVPALEEVEEAPQRGSGETVLLVDDEETVRDVGVRMLEKSGFNVLVACDGHQALELFRSHASEIDVVLLDLTMPGIDGAETFGRLRGVNDGVPVVLGSGYHKDEVASRFEGKGFAAFVQKPYQREALAKTLKEVFARGR